MSEVPEMVDRVARAIYDAFREHAWGPPQAGTRYETWDEAGPRNKVRYTAIARATIPAMREPTEAMRNAGWPVEGLDSEFRDSSETWKLMIDAALGV